MVKFLLARLVGGMVRNMSGLKEKLNYIYKFFNLLVSKVKTTRRKIVQ